MNRVPQLDLLRGIAVLLVIVFHYNDRFPGWVGVDLFFVLSGYLISGLLVDDPRIGRFLVRRGFKIYPAYFFFLLTCLLMDPAHLGRRIWPEFLFVQNYYHAIWGHTWSLAVEEHFYLVLPFFLLVVKREWLPKVCLGIMAACLAIRIYMLVSGGSIDLIQYSTHTRFDGLFAGVALRQAQLKAANWMPWVAALFLLPAAIFAKVSIPMLTYGFTCNIVAFGLLIVWAIGTPRLHLKPLEQIGTYSYSIYLWHFLITMAATTWWIAILGSVVVGIATAFMVELPMLALRDRLTSTGSRTSPSGKLIPQPVER